MQIFKGVGMNGYVMSDEEIKDCLNKCDYILEALESKVNSHLVNNGWSEIEDGSDEMDWVLASEFYRYPVYDGVEYMMAIRCKGFGRECRSAATYLALRSCDVANAVNASRRVVNGLSRMTSGDVFVESRTRRDIFDVMAFDIDCVNLDDYVDIECAYKMFNDIQGVLSERVSQLIDIEKRKQRKRKQREQQLSVNRVNDTAVTEKEPIKKKSQLKKGWLSKIFS